MWVWNQDCLQTNITIQFERDFVHVLTLKSILQWHQDNSHATLGAVLQLNSPITENYQKCGFDIGLRISAQIESWKIVNSTECSLFNL